MREIPKEILDRCTFKVNPSDNTKKLHKIKPMTDCPCGVQLESIRYVRIRKTVEPRPHYREYCATCKLTSMLGKNDWKPAAELNQEIRSKNTALKQKD